MPGNSEFPQIRTRRIGAEPRLLAVCCWSEADAQRLLPIWPGPAVSSPCANFERWYLLPGAGRPLLQGDSFRSRPVRAETSVSPRPQDTDWPMRSPRNNATCFVMCVTGLRRRTVRPSHPYARIQCCHRRACRYESGRSCRQVPCRCIRDRTTAPRFWLA